MPSGGNRDSGISQEIARLSSQLAKDPKSKLFIPLAEEYMKSGMVEEAVMTLEQGLETHPSYMSARVLLGKAYLAAGDDEKACVQFETVVNAIPDNLFALRKLGEIYRGQGRQKDALRTYNMINILSPGDKESARLLAELKAGELKAPPATPGVTDGPALPHHEGEPSGGAAEPAERPTEAPAGPETGMDGGFLDMPAEDEGVLPAEEAPELWEPEPELMEMPVPEMDTLEDILQAGGREPDVPEAAGDIEDDVLFSAGGEDILDAEDMLDAEVGLVEDVAGEDFGGWAPAETRNEQEPGAGQPEEGGRPGYGLRLDEQSGLAELLSSYSPGEAAAPGGEDTEAPSGVAGNVYELPDDPVSGSDISGFEGLRIEPPVPVREQEPAGPAAPARTQETPKKPQEGSPAGSINTEALAELYISQGFLDRAIGVYKDLLAEFPEDERLKAKLEDIYALAQARDTKPGGMAGEASADAGYEPVDFAAFEEDAMRVEEMYAGGHSEPAMRYAGPMEEAATTPALQHGGTASGVDEAAIERLQRFLDNVRRKARE